MWNKASFLAYPGCIAGATVSVIWVVITNSTDWAGFDLTVLKSGKLKIISSMSLNWALVLLMRALPSRPDYLSKTPPSHDLQPVGSGGTQIFIAAAYNSLQCRVTEIWGQFVTQLYLA